MKTPQDDQAKDEHDFKPYRKYVRLERRLYTTIRYDTHVSLCDCGAIKVDGPLVWEVTND